METKIVALIIGLVMVASLASAIETEVGTGLYAGMGNDSNASVRFEAWVSMNDSDNDTMNEDNDSMNAGVSGDVDLDIFDDNTGGSIITVTSPTSAMVNGGNGEFEVLVRSDLSLDVENDRLVVYYEDETRQTLQVTPQEAVARAEMEVGGSCMEDCEVEIDRESEAQGDILVYEVEVQKQTRVLGLWDAQMDIGTRIDAQTGAVLDIDRPWWAFLASETSVNT